MEEFEALVNPQDAIHQWNATTFTFDGETRAHEYHWLYNLLTLGQVDAAVTANTPLYSVCKNPSTGKLTHAAYNPGTAPLSVAFSDGYPLTVPAGSLGSEFGNTGLSGGTSTVTSPPPTVLSAPTNLAVAAASTSQIDLSWTASATSGVTNNVYSSTTSGITPASSNRLTNVSGTSASATGLAAGTTYYFVVRATNSAGESASSNQASAVTQTASSSSGAPISIHAGGNAAGSWVADTDVSGGTVATPETTAVDTSQIPAPVPPQCVYQTQRYGPMTYTIAGLKAGQTYTVQLHFAETYWPAANNRQFNVLINGVKRLTNFDIFAMAGGANKAIEQNFSATPVNNAITIQFTKGSYDQPKVDRIAVF